MIGVNSLSMHYNGRLLYDEVNLHLLRGNRYGLVGANGCGKSTFLRLLSGAETPSLGDILLPKAACIGWLKQDQFRYEQNTLVVYRKLYDDYSIWLRPRAMFEETITHEGKTQPRFQFIKPLDTEAPSLR